MAELGIDLDNALIEGIRGLAVRHYGDDEDASIRRVVEAAVEMRLLWANHVEGDGNEVEEPIVNWQFQDGKRPAEIRDWLFRRR